MEYQMRNWYYFTWLSGDHNVEQHIHSLDKALWLMGDEPPASCLGLGGRQVRTDEQWGTHLRPPRRLLRMGQRRSQRFAYTRQMAGCFNERGRLRVRHQGARPTSSSTRSRARASGVTRGDKPSMYD